jgi:hypothetical protein
MRGYHVSDADDIAKALSTGGRQLQIESLGSVLKSVTFNINNLKMWKNPYEDYEVVDLHGMLKKGTITYEDRKAIFEMFGALANVRIIRDTQNSSAERIYVDARVPLENSK